LLESLDDPERARIDAVWAIEADKRVAQVDEGKVDALPGEEVMEGLRSRLK